MALTVNNPVSFMTRDHATGYEEIANMATATQRRRKAAQRRHWEDTHRTRPPLVEGVARHPSFHTSAYRKRHPYGSSLILGVHGGMDLQNLHHAMVMEGEVIVPAKDFKPAGWSGSFTNETGGTTIVVGDLEKQWPTELTYENMDDYLANNASRTATYQVAGESEIERVYLPGYIHPLRVPEKRWVALKDVDAENDGRITNILTQEPNNTRASLIINRLGFHTTEASIRRYRKHMADHA
jgi:hypothetical protein